MKAKSIPVGDFVGYRRAGASDAGNRTIAALVSSTRFFFRFDFTHLGFRSDLDLYYT